MKLQEVRTIANGQGIKPAHLKRLNLLKPFSGSKAIMTVLGTHLRHTARLPVSGEKIV